MNKCSQSLVNRCAVARHAHGFLLQRLLYKTTRRWWLVSSCRSNVFSHIHFLFKKLILILVLEPSYSPLNGLAYF